MIIVGVPDSFLHVFPFKPAVTEEIIMATEGHDYFFHSLKVITHSPIPNNTSKAPTIVNTISIAILKLSVNRLINTSADPIIPIAINTTESPTRIRLMIYMS